MEKDSSFYSLLPFRPGQGCRLLTALLVIITETGAHSIIVVSNFCVILPK